jgi:hypothetical protein
LPCFDAASGTSYRRFMSSGSNYLDPDRPEAVRQPLYASLSPEQQQVANQLVAPHHERHHRA